MGKTEIDLCIVCYRFYCDELCPMFYENKLIRENPPNHVKKQGFDLTYKNGTLVSYDEYGNVQNQDSNKRYNSELNGRDQPEGWTDPCYPHKIICLCGNKEFFVEYSEEYHTSIICNNCNKKSSVHTG